MEEQEDHTNYKVVINHEEQYSIWPVDRENPLGWNDVGKTGLKQDCLAYIEEVWTDMRPLSVRKHMEEMEKRRPELEEQEAARIEKEKNKKKDPRDNLVNYLAEGEHPVEIDLRPKKTLEELKACIDRGYIYVKFTKTRGGTELGFHIDQESSNTHRADFEKGSGTIHLEGKLTLNYVKVNCVADIDIATFNGKGHLDILQTDKER